MLKILVDFNAMSEDGKMVWINTQIRQDLLKELHAGLHVMLYEPNQLEVEAVVVLEKGDDGQDWWYGMPDWSTEHDIQTE